MADPTFWQNMAFDGASAIGQTNIDTRPYTLLSGGTSSMAQKVLDDAAALFPEFDGVTNIALPLPSDFANPTLESFLNWHTAHQVQFLKQQSPSWQAGDLRTVTFGTSSNVFENSAFMLSADGRRVIHINTLQTGDIATLPLTDQEHLADLPVFRLMHSNILGLWPSDAIYGPYTDTSPAPPTTLAEARQKVKELIDLLETAVQSAAIPARRNEEVTASNIRELYANLFLDQIALFRQRTDNMGIFNPDAIKREVKDIQDRFERIQKFMNVTAPTESPALPGFQQAANSTDNLTSLNRALDIFLRSEARIHSLAKQSEKIVFFGVYGPDGQERPADAPMMVFLLQTQENYRAEAEAEAKSEEMNQLNQIMQAYTRIQAMVNQTLQTFDPVAFQAANQNDDKALERKGFMGGLDLMNMSLSDADKLVVSMFDTTLAKANSNSFHPLEIEINAARPSFEITTNGGNPAVLHSQKEWDLFSNTLGQTAKIISQDSQKRMDEVNRISRGKNKNYELASDTLNKMTDMLRSIVN